MYRSLHLPFLVLCLVCSLAPAETLAQPADGIPAEAQRRLEMILGDWQSTWEHLDAEGKVVHTSTGTESARWTIEGRVIELTTHVPERHSHSKALMFYNQTEELFYLVSVDQRGDLWVMSGGLESYVITSRPHRNPDGSEVMIRFTHHEDDADRFRAVMELSQDNGATWTKQTLQTLERVK